MVVLEYARLSPGAIEASSSTYDVEWKRSRSAAFSDLALIPVKCLGNGTVFEHSMHVTQTLAIFWMGFDDRQIG